MGLFLVACSNVNNSTAASEEANSVLQEIKPEELTLYIVWHGKTMLNTTDCVQGWSDVVLTPAREEIVKAAGTGLKDIDFQNAYSSNSGELLKQLTSFFQKTSTLLI